MPSIKHAQKKKSECPHCLNMAILTSDKTKCDVCEIDAHLRLCTTCGSVNCCESGNSHDKAHFNETGHSIIIPTNASYQFIWCWECEAFLID